MLTRGAEPPGPPANVGCRRWSALRAPETTSNRECACCAPPGARGYGPAAAARLSRHGPFLPRSELPSTAQPVATPAARVLQGPDRARLLDPAARAVPGA